MKSGSHQSNVGITAPAAGPVDTRAGWDLTADLNPLDGRFFECSNYLTNIAHAPDSGPVRGLTEVGLQTLVTPDHCHPSS